MLHVCTPNIYVEFVEHVSDGSSWNNFFKWKTVIFPLCELFSTVMKKFWTDDKFLNKKIII